MPSNFSFSALSSFLSFRRVYSCVGLPLDAYKLLKINMSKTKLLLSEASPTHNLFHCSSIFLVPLAKTHKIHSCLLSFSYMPP